MSFFKKLFGPKKENQEPEVEPERPVVPVRDLSLADQPMDCVGIDWNESGQVELLSKLFSNGLSPSLEHQLSAEDFLGNQWCHRKDAAVLYAMAGHFQPGRVMEVGSGYTTRILRLAKDDFSLPGELIAVDPDPRTDIGEFVDAHLIMPVEEVPLDDFKMLQPGEMAFFDSTHIYTDGSDSKHIIDEILPVLESGVIVGFHGARLPRNYTREELQQGWSEQDALLEWMKQNGPEVLFCGGITGAKVPGEGNCTALWFRIRVKGRQE